MDYMRRIFWKGTVELSGGQEALLLFAALSPFVSLGLIGPVVVLAISRSDEIVRKGAARAFAVQVLGLVGGILFLSKVVFVTPASPTAVDRVIGVAAGSVVASSVVLSILLAVAVARSSGPMYGRQEGSIA